MEDKKDAHTPLSPSGYSLLAARRCMGFVCIDGSGSCDSS